MFSVALLGRLPWKLTALGCWLLLTTVRGGVARSTTASLYVSNGSHILHLTPTGQVESVISQDIHRAVGLAVDMWRDLIFWTDIGAGHQGVYRASLDGSKVTRIIQDVGRLNGLSVDWVGSHVYWTDEERQSIEMCGYDGGNRKILIDKDLKWPRGIIVDPVDGLMYWGDQGTQQIERARADGTERHSLVSTGLIWPNQLAISYHTKRLYWVDAFNRTIESCDLLGRGRREEHDLLESPYSAPVFGLAIFNHSAYISTWYNGAIYSVPFGHEADTQDTLYLEAEKLTQKEMFSIAVGERQVQPKESNPCGQSNKGGCSHVCIMTSSTGFRCACPTYGALVLGPDKKTCHEPSELLLYADKDKGHIGILPLDGDNVTDHYILATSVMPVAIGYDPVDHLVYWSDVKERVIYRVGLKSLEKEVFLSEAHGIGTVDGLYIDWQNRRLYFCNMGNSSPKSDGAVFSWHRLEFISLDRQQRRVVVTSADKPRAIQIDSQKGFLYYTDWGHDPQVVRTRLDGSDPVTIRVPGSVSNPNGLALSGRWLYLVDSNYNGMVDTPYMAVYDTELGTWTTLEDAKVTIPFGVAAKDTMIFYTDWLSTETSTGAVMAYDMITRTTFVLSDRMSNPTGLHFSPASAQKTDLGLCSKHDCSDICIPVPEERSYHCMCSEGTGKVLQADGKTCLVPDNFLLFTDLNTIKMVPVTTSSVPESQTEKSTDSDPHTYFVHYGEYSSNYVAVAYDKETDHIYWSDLNRKQILMRPLSGGSVHIFHQGEHAVDGMAFDCRGRHLYWTGYNDYSGIIAMATVNETLGGATYTELLTGLDQPRAIVLDLNSRFMYWTEYGVKSGKPRLGRAYLDGTSNETLADTDLVWPNALAISANLLYLADGSHRRIDVFNLDGSNRKELPLLTRDMDHIFGMAVFGDLLYYTDWLANITAVANIKSGSIRTLSANLYRPGTVLLHHYTSETLELTDCRSGHHDCSEICIEVPDGYQCACPLGKKLADDRKSCMDATIWEATDWFRCNEQCHSNAHCARLNPTSVFRCVCREGFHGDGVRECDGCPQDTYKPNIGNGTCKLCPLGATTIGWTASATCTCDDANYDFIGDECVTHEAGGTLGNLSSRSPIPGYAISPPIFLNCPEGEILQYQLTENSSDAILDIPLSATNWKGQEVSISGLYPMPPGAKFPWKGPGKKGYHHVTYRATDVWGLEAVCNFTIQVIDNQPPLFDRCPGNMELQTSTGHQRVFWEEPQAYDNVAISEIRRPLLKSGSLFDVGEWRQTYRVTDGEGSAAWCNFTITIIQIDILCDTTSFSDPLNGGIECSQVPGKAYRCETFCDHIHHYMNPSPEYQMLYCQSNGHWRDSFPEDYVTKACLRKTAARVVLQKLHFWLYGPCDPASGNLKSDIKSAILNLLEEDGLCTWSYGGSDVYNTCNEEIDVECGQDEATRRRRKRRDDVASNVGVDAGDVLVLWTVMADAKTEDTGTSNNLTEVEEKVTRRASRLRARFDLGMTFDAAGSTYRSKTEKAVVAPLILECGRGSFNTSNVCLLCPIGTYQWEEEGSCTDCPAGSYQDVEGQGTCKQCPPGSYSQRGSFNVSQCFPVAGQPPALHSGGKAVIIGVCSLVLALLTLILVFLCFRHYRRHKRFSGKMCDTGRSGQESPYVIEIRTNGHGSIAYEEINEPEKNQKTPIKVSHEHLQQSSNQAPPNDNIDLPQKEGAIIRNNRAPPRGSTEKSQPLMGDNREEICLEVQSVLQAGNGSKADDNVNHVGYRDDDLEDTPVHSSTALLDHSRDDNLDD